MALIHLAKLMATFDAISALDHNFVANPKHPSVLILGSVDLLDFASEVSGTSTSYEWLTSSGHRISARGVFTYSGGVVSGTVSDVAIYLDNVGGGDILIDNISNGTIGSLLSGHEAFWASVFSGNDEFSTSVSGFSSISGDGFIGHNGGLGGNDQILVFEGNFYTSASGDYSETAAGATVTGGIDTFSVDGNPGIGGASLQGDAYVVAATSTLYGGNDVFTGVSSGGSKIGDAHITLGTLYGGNDTIDVDGNDAEGTISGDAWVVGGQDRGGVPGTLYGGADFITGNTDYVTGESHQFYGGILIGGNDIILNNRSTTTFIDGLFGDVRFINTEATAESVFVGGHDTITYIGPYSSTIVGDIGELEAGSLITDITFGNDILRGSNSSGIGPGGTTYGDTIYGDYKNDYVGVLATAKGGNDWIDGGDGDDRLFGQNGIDTVAFEFATHVVNVDLNLQGASQVTGGGFNDYLEGFENIFGSAQADTLLGDSNDNIIEGAAGGDILDGRGGTDTITYMRSTAGVTISLLANTASGGHAAGDVISRFENIVGSIHADTLTGNNFANVIEGGAGGDTLTGNLGLDTLSYLLSDAAVTVNISNNTSSGGHATGDIFSGFENVLGSTLGDTLTGSNAANVLSGGGGDDTLDGGSGIDVLNGGNGNDRVIYSSFTIGAAFNFVSQVYQGDVNETWSNIESATGTQGNDNFTPSLASNYIDGQGGIDTVSYNDSNAAVIINLNGTAGIGGSAEGDTLTNIETVIGSAFEDVITGTSIAETLQGRNGDDFLSGGYGNDTLNGGADADTLGGGGGRDVGVFAGLASGATLNFVGVSTSVTTAVGGSDTLTNVEVLQFDDRMVVIEDPLTDFNADANSDLLWFRQNDGYAYLWTMDENAQTGSAALGQIGGDWTIQTTGDFNGDGSSDFMWKNTSTGQFYIWNFTNGVQSGGANLGNIGTSWNVRGAGDFNADGNGDIAWRNSDGHIYVYSMNNNVVQSGVSFGIIGSEWDIGAVGDFNGDGSSDIALRRSTDGLVYIWSVENNAIIDGDNLGAIGTNWSIQGAGDFNNDGTDDLLLRDANDGTLYFYFMQNSMVNAGASLGALGTDWLVDTVSDLDGDLQMDLALKNTSTGQFYIYNIENGAISGGANLGVVGTDWELV